MNKSVFCNLIKYCLKTRM